MCFRKDDLIKLYTIINNNEYVDKFKLNDYDSTSYIEICKNPETKNIELLFNLTFPDRNSFKIIIDNKNKENLLVGFKKILSDIDSIEYELEMTAKYDMNLSI